VLFARVMAWRKEHSTGAIHVLATPAASLVLVTVKVAACNGLIADKLSAVVNKIVGFMTSLLKFVATVSG
jgi:hypothetical protein